MINKIKLGILILMGLLIFNYIFNSQPLKKLDTTYSGTGFFINNEGYIATAYHVVEGSKRLYVVYNGNLETAYGIAFDKDHDIAIIKINKSNTSFLLLAIKYNIGDKVGLYGYPMPDYKGFDLKLSIGTIISNNGELLRDNAVICGGNSGGPVISQYGRVVSVAQGNYTYSNTGDGNCGWDAYGMIGAYLYNLAINNGVKISYGDNLDIYDFNILRQTYQFNNTIVLIYSET